VQRGNLMSKREQKYVPHREFHVSRLARDQYQFDQSLFTLTGNVIFANFRATRVFAKRMNDKRDLVNFPEQTIRAGQINALGLIDEILHYVVTVYREQIDPEVMHEAVDLLYEKLGRPSIDIALSRFIEEFPPVAIYLRQTDVQTWLAEETGGVSNRQIALEEMLMLWLTDMNPATAPFLELFDDASLEKDTAYLKIIAQLQEFFANRPWYGPDHQPLIDMLRAPAIAVPHSLSGQLEYILQRWGSLLGKYLYRLLGSLDLIKEEEKLFFLGAGPALVPVYDLSALEGEAERFSPDKDWMPNLVMIAKNSYVWLDQLSRKYQRAITHLDQIPDEELDQLARWGFTGLWFIGIWERSTASQRIKQMMGNPDAVASAYSLFDYQIANDLGGEAAYQSLRERAWLRGIRLASDMVPNHMAIDSKWVIEHPDWFVSLDYSPFPSYTFEGPDWSWDARVGIFVEDHYYNRTDAAVVFKRVDKWTGDEKYIYHGNDGTSFPWNDTAQLNYLKPEVREAVIQTILHVARKFPIIRFDAAMTLTKKHFQRLWFPEPGTGGAIPSRADHGLTREQFDALMPLEFWREVVDRAAVEAPDTLLLAEAFWLLEGYFVRTLGMHRVYNSAFMHMLRDEDNAKYRSVIKNTIEFDPEILKRYVNFMNNPDERTAVDQFGKDDKYFGVCTMLATMPGLPMFGHGQIEGYAEKYGMDFRRALWDEQPDEWLIQRHEREIFPLLRKRYLFAGVEHFLLYDFFNADGTVDEDVFAYSNGVGPSAASEEGFRSGERALMVYHNKFEQARGWIRTSTAYLEKGRATRALVQKSLGEGLALRADEVFFAIFRDSVSGLEYIRSSKELCEKGLYVEVGAYKYHVFLDWREVQDNAWHRYAHLNAYLNGRGVPSIEEALREVFLQPVREPFTELVNAEMFRRLMAARLQAPDDVGANGRSPRLDEVQQKLTQLLREIKNLQGAGSDELKLAEEIREELDAALELPIIEYRFPTLQRGAFSAALEFLRANLDDDAAQWAGIFSWVFVHALGKIVDEEDNADQSRTWIDEWLLGKIVAGALRDMGLDYGAAWWMVGLVKILTAHQAWLEDKSAHQILEHWLQDEDVRMFLKENRHQGVLWFNKESFEQLLQWMFRIAVIALSRDPSRPPEKVATQIVACYSIVKELRRAEAESKFQVEKLLEAAKGERGAAR
jgi:glycosidase